VGLLPPLNLSHGRSSCQRLRFRRNKAVSAEGGFLAAATYFLAAPEIFVDGPGGDKETKEVADSLHHSRQDL
jgi:hypothetical protein